MKRGAPDALAATRSSPERPLRPRLRGALLGAGNIALRGHAPQWTALGDEVEIAAVADLSAKNLEAARAAFPGARLYESADALFAAERLDFVDVCTPPHTHRALVEAAAARGAHVLCEKPLAPTVEEAEAIAAAVRKAGVAFVPCHQYHHAPQWAETKRAVARLGRVHFAEYEVLRIGANEGNPHWSPAWRTDRTLAGGGILVDHGAHIFYQLRAVLGEPKAVTATARTLKHRAYGVEDTALVTLDYGDRIAQVSLTWAALRREIRFRFVGEAGELMGDDERLRVQEAGGELREVAFGEGMSESSSHSSWFAPLLGDFVRRAREGDGRTDGLEEAVWVTKLIAAAYRSSEEGRTIPLAGGPPTASR